MSMLHAFITLLLTILLMEGPSAAAEQMRTSEVLAYFKAGINNSSLPFEQRQDIATAAFTAITTGTALNYDRQTQTLPKNMPGTRLSVSTPDLALKEVQVMGLSKTLVATNDQAVLYVSIAMTAAVLGVNIVNIVETAMKLSIMQTWQKHLKLLHNLSSFIKSKVDKTLSETKLDAYFSNLTYNGDDKAVNSFTFLDHVATRVSSGANSLVIADNRFRMPGIEAALTQTNDYLEKKKKATEAGSISPIPPKEKAIASTTSVSESKIKASDSATEILTKPILLKLRGGNPAKQKEFIAIFDERVSKIPQQRGLSEETHALACKVVLAYTLEYAIDRAPGVFDFADFLDILKSGKDTSDINVFEEFRKPEDKALAAADKESIARAKSARDTLYGSVQHSAVLSTIVFPMKLGNLEASYQEKLTEWERANAYLKVHPTRPDMYDEVECKNYSHHSSVFSSGKPQAFSAAEERAKVELQLKGKKLSFADVFTVLEKYKADMKAWTASHGKLYHHVLQDGSSMSMPLSGDAAEPNPVAYLDALISSISSQCE